MSLTVIVVGSPIKGGIDGYNAAGVLGCTGETIQQFTFNGELSVIAKKAASHRIVTLREDIEKALDDTDLVEFAACRRISHSPILSHMCTHSLPTSYTHTHTLTLTTISHSVHHPLPLPIPLPHCLTCALGGVIGGILLGAVVGAAVTVMGAMTCLWQVILLELTVLLNSTLFYSI